MNIIHLQSFVQLEEEVKLQQINIIKNYKILYYILKWRTSPLPHKARKKKA